MNFHSAEWKQTVAECDGKIAILDRMNRGKLGADETATIRGQILGLLWLLEWPTRAEAQAQTDSGVEILT